MHRTARIVLGGYCYHVLNRGNGRAEAFRRMRNCAAKSLFLTDFFVLLLAMIFARACRPR